MDTVHAFTKRELSSKSVVVIGIVVGVIGINVVLFFTWCLVRARRRARGNGKLQREREIEKMSSSSSITRHDRPYSFAKTSFDLTDDAAVQGPPRSAKAGEAAPGTDARNRGASSSEFERRHSTVTPLRQVYLSPDTRPEPPMDIFDTTRGANASTKTSISPPRGTRLSQVALEQAMAASARERERRATETGTVDFNENKARPNKSIGHAHPQASSRGLSRPASVASSSSMYSASSAPLEKHNSLVRKPVPFHLLQDAYSTPPSSNSSAGSGDGDGGGSKRSTPPRASARYFITNDNPSPSSDTAPPVPALPPSLVPGTLPPTVTASKSDKRLTSPYSPTKETKTPPRLAIIAAEAEQQQETSSSASDVSSVPPLPHITTLRGPRPPPGSARSQLRPLPTQLEPPSGPTDSSQEQQRRSAPLQIQPLNLTKRNSLDSSRSRLSTSTAMLTVPNSAPPTQTKLTVSAPPPPPPRSPRRALPTPTTNPPA